MTKSSTGPDLAPAMAHARREAFLALNHPDAADLLRAYYDPAGNYAGATFVELEPNDPLDVTATDLYALSLLSVNAGPRAGRALLTPGPHRDLVRAALADPALPVDADLLTADADTTEAAERLYLAVRDALGNRPWVTASKLCARKRPHLFPVRDSVVTLKRLKLGLDYLVDWQVYRALLGDHELTAALREVTARAQEGVSFPITEPALRTLDVLLWMTADASMRPRRQR